MNDSFAAKPETTTAGANASPPQPLSPFRSGSPADSGSSFATCERPIRSGSSGLFPSHRMPDPFSGSMARSFFSPPAPGLLSGSMARSFFSPLAPGFLSGSMVRPDKSGHTARAEASFRRPGLRPGLPISCSWARGSCSSSCRRAGASSPLWRAPPGRWQSATAEFRPAP